MSLAISAVDAITAQSTEHVRRNQERHAGSTHSLDGLGADDHDLPYRFGWRPSAGVPFPFNTRQYARLLILRSRFQATGGTAAKAA